MNNQPYRDHESGDDSAADTKPERVCAVCGRMLNYYDDLNDPSQSRYVHTNWDNREGESHPPVPVEPTEVPQQVIERCDFCHADYPAWRVPVRAFSDPTGISNPDWLACDECAGLITKDQWSALARRALAGWSERHPGPVPPEVETHLKSLYRKVRKNMTGLPKPNSDSAPPQPPGR